MFVLNCILLFISHYFVLLALGVFKFRKVNTFFKLNPFEFRFMPFQLLCDCFCHISELLRNIDDHSSLILVFVHSSDCFIEWTWELFPEKVPDVFQTVEFNIHIESVCYVSWHAEVKWFRRLPSPLLKLEQSSSCFFKRYSHVFQKFEGLWSWVGCELNIRNHLFLKIAFVHFALIFFKLHSYRFR